MQDNHALISVLSYAHCANLNTGLGIQYYRPIRAE